MPVNRTAASLTGREVQPESRQINTVINVESVYVSASAAARVSPFADPADNRTV